MDEVIKYFGGQRGVAGALGVSDAAVSQWVAAGGLPPKRAIEVERLTLGLFRAVDITVDMGGEE